MSELDCERDVSPKIRKRAEWLLSIAVCTTKTGLWTHLNLIGFDDLKVLLKYLRCSLDDLVEKSWAYKKGLLIVE